MKLKELWNYKTSYSKLLTEKCGPDDFKTEKLVPK